MTTNLRILLLENDPDDAFLIQSLLEKTGKQDLVNVRTLRGAVEQLAHGGYDLIVSNLSLPDSSGQETAKRLLTAAGEVPIVVLTATEDAMLDCALVSTGVQDILPKCGLEAKRLRQALVHALERQRLWHDARHSTLHDPLTRLPNRTLLIKHLSHSVQDALRRGERLALAYVDLDGFKAINDTHGREVGDLLLRNVAARLNEGIRKVDMVAHLGGDEFAWNMPMIADPFLALQRVKRMVDEVGNPYELEMDGRPLRVSIGVSAGVSICPDHAEEPNELIAAADQAMYLAKRQGGNRVHVHGAQFDVRSDRQRGEKSAPEDQAKGGAKLRVLLVEDDPDDRKLVEKAAGKALWDWHVHWVQTLKEGLHTARTEPVDVALLDLNLPDATGIETVIRFVRALPNVPVVVMTGGGDDPLGLDAIKKGAQDFLSKSLPDLAFWPRAARYAIERHALVRQSDAARQRAQVANTDLLTGLPNRREFQARLDELLSQPHSPPEPFSLIIIDLVQFQSINQRLGYLVGDEVLRIIGGRLRETLGDDHLAARLGGDEFSALLFGLGAGERLDKALKDIVGNLCRTMTVEDRPLRTSVRSGVASYPEHGLSASALMRAADLALRQAKEAGGKPVVRYKAKYGEEADSRRRMENMLRCTMSEGGIKLLFQPIVDARSGELRSLEALLRWRDPEGGMLAPARFMPVAEASGLIAHIDTLVLREVCRLCHDWLPGARLKYPGLSIALNVSAITINVMDYADTVYWMLDEYDIVDIRPDIEITESALSRDLNHTLDQIRRIDGLGVRVSLDDFGAEYSSLNYLRTLPVRKLKIDRSFIKDLPSQPRDRLIVDSLIELAGDLRFQVIVEGVETEAQRALVARHDGALLQGYLIARPMELDAVCDLFSIDTHIALRA